MSVRRSPRGYATPGGARCWCWSPCGRTTWETLTTRPRAGQPDPHAQARELLDGHKIKGSDAFTGADLVTLTEHVERNSRLAEAAPVAEDAAEVARLLGAGQELVMALTQQCLVASLSGEDDKALANGKKAVEAVGDDGWWANHALHVYGLALINAGRKGDGADLILRACGGLVAPDLAPMTLLACCETMAEVEAERGWPEEAAFWAEHAEKNAHSLLEGSSGLARLARAQALRFTDPAQAAVDAVQAAQILSDVGLQIDCGRARLTSARAYAAADTAARHLARDELRAAAEIFAACGARSLHAQVIRQQRRLGVRVPAGAARGTGPYSLSGREAEVAVLVAEGYTNHQIAERLFISDRTVETHLSRIFAKLDVTSRVGVVKAIAQLDLG